MFDVACLFCGRVCYAQLSCAFRFFVVCGVGVYITLVSWLFGVLRYVWVSLRGALVCSMLCRWGVD